MQTAHNAVRSLWHEVSRYRLIEILLIDKIFESNFLKRSKPFVRSSKPKSIEFKYSMIELVIYIYICIYILCLYWCLMFKHNYIIYDVVWWFIKWCIHPTMLMVLSMVELDIRKWFHHLSKYFIHTVPLVQLDVVSRAWCRIRLYRSHLPWWYIINNFTIFSVSSRHIMCKETYALKDDDVSLTGRRWSNDE